jgi:Fe2+ transport system protein B
MFYDLTGSRRCGQLAGVTVEKKGKLKGHRSYRVGLPAFTRFPLYAEEVIARDYLIGEKPM